VLCLAGFVCSNASVYLEVFAFLPHPFTTPTSTPNHQEVARSTETGAATNIIYGLALGYKSAIIPVTVLAIAILVSFKLIGMYGISLAALGMLSTLATCLSIDVYGPICDNAGGIAEYVAHSTHTGSACWSG
jgi:Na+/H+-translocating membrane pyrophosphatase